MTKQELKQQAFQIYAVLGELGVLRKQKLQEIQNIDSQIEIHEKKLVELANTKTTESEE